MSILRNVAISESGFLFNPTTGDSFTLNETAMFVLALLKDNKTKEHVIDEVLDKYDVDKDVFVKDFDDLMYSLKSYKLIGNEN